VSTERTLESFDKKDLIQLIQRRFFSLDRSLLELTSIERERKGAALMAQMETLESAMAEITLPVDWERHTALSEKWNKASKAWSKLYGIGRV